MEQWLHWNLGGDATGMIVVQGFCLSGESLTVAVYAPKKDVKITLLFQSGMLSYRYTNESWCFDMFAVLRRDYGNEFIRDWRFFKVQNSNYAQSIMSQCGLLGNHFCVLGDDEIIDIVALDEPVITISVGR